MDVDVLAALPDPSEYYDQRHAIGWMDKWPQYKKTRVIGMIRGAGPGEGSKVLEYGCGAGVFAGALKRAEPDLEVHGCDISTVALAKASRNCPEVVFHQVGGDSLQGLYGQFDVVYTHHVLEHVHDLDDALALVAKLLKPGGVALHVAPSANPGSLEHTISLATGFGADEYGRFCCDDSSHLRRLTEKQLRDACGRHGLWFRESFHANQYWGAMDYLTNQYWARLVEWMHPSQGVTASDKLRLAMLLSVVLTLTALKTGPAYVLKGLFAPRSLGRAMVFLLAALPAILLWPISKLVQRGLEWARDREWEQDRRDPRGSEMYCLFEKRQSE